MASETQKNRGVLYEVGKVINKYPIEVISDKFSKQEIILDLSEDFKGKTFERYIMAQCVNAQTKKLDNINEGDTVEVELEVGNYQLMADAKHGNRNKVIANVTILSIKKLGGDSAIQNERNANQENQNPTEEEFKVF